jgi:hypothetical protein
VITIYLQCIKRGFGCALMHVCIRGRSGNLQAKFPLRGEVQGGLLKRQGRKAWDSLRLTPFTK